MAKIIVVQEELTTVVQIPGQQGPQGPPGSGGSGGGDIAMADLTAHSADTTSIHGISNTANIVYTTDLNNHTADTTSVHGISNTADIVYTDDPRLEGGGDVATHSADTTSIHGISNTANLVYTSDSRLSDARTPTTHTHTQAQITDLDANLDGLARVIDEKINVKDPQWAGGASGNNTDDRAAIQAAINGAISGVHGKGTVFFPPGKYGIDCTTAGISLPNEKTYTLRGAGATIHSPAGIIGGVIPDSTVVINRIAGTQPLVSNPDSGANGPRLRAHIYDITFRNGGVNARCAWFRRINSMILRGVRFEGNASTTPYTGLTVPSVEIMGLWNSAFYNCFWTGIGNGTTYPALLVSHGEGTGSGASVTSHFTDCEWENNHGTDFKTHAQGTGVNGNLGINVVNAKMEGQHNTARNWPCIEVGNADQHSFVGCSLYTGGPAPVVIYTSEGNINTFTGNSFYNSGSGTGNRPLFRQSGGRVILAGNTFFNWPALVNTGWEIGSAVPGGGAISGGNIYYTQTQGAATSGKQWTDARTGARPAGLLAGVSSANYPAGPELCF